MSKLDHILEHVTHLLPTQGPLEVFVHHNTLHAFEDLPFLEAVEKAGRIYGAEPYLSEERYREEFAKGRIEERDLRDVLEEQGVEQGRSLDQVQSLFFSAPPRLTRQLVMWHLLENGGLEELGRGSHSFKWEAAVAQEQGHLRDSKRLKERFERFARPGSYWNAEDSAVEDRYRILMHSSAPVARQRGLVELWLSSLEIASSFTPSEEGRRGDRETAYQAIMPVITKLAASFVDEGLSSWPLLKREEGFYAAALTFLSSHELGRGWPLRGIRSLVTPYVGRHSGAVIEELLIAEGVIEDEWEQKIQEELISLKGWAGFLSLLERREEVGSLPKSSRIDALKDLLAVKMLLERHAETTMKRGEEKGVDLYFDHLYLTAYHLFKWCQAEGVTGEKLLSLNKDNIEDLFTAWSALRRRRCWHLAYERFLQRRAYSALLSAPPASPSESEKFQVICCIDDREESFRRCLEEAGGEVSTYGTAGFFGVDVEFEGIGKEAEPFCPVVITPRHRVVERPKAGMEGVIDRRRRVVESFLKSKGLVEWGSRTAVVGWGVTLLGGLAFLPMAVRTLFPRLSHLLTLALQQTVPHQATDIHYHAVPGEESESSMVGYAGFELPDMVQRVSGLLRGIGLVESFAPLIFLLGHGSSSRNNPFRSAYDCGACGGRPGRINARVFALMANRDDVRGELKKQGIVIPETTRFVGGYHDTCNDAVTFFDTEELLASETLRPLFDEFQYIVEEARKRNARERCRRFGTAHVRTKEEALRHVQARSDDIAEPRPEYGHATNALCIVGRRAVTRGVFYDRRAFLVSYDPSRDEKGDILTSMLSAVVPVCMGINLEYFFSSIDNETYGAGTKLPLNITSLIGTITGYASDLRTGLPAQMVEIHEPVRLVMIVEAPRERMETVLQRLPYVRKVMVNSWVVLATYDPEKKELWRMNEKGEFALWRGTAPIAQIHDTEGWVTSSTEHLPFALLEQAQ